jgi:hypothetical protein
LRITGTVSAVSEDGFDYDCGNWSSAGDHDMKRLGYTWVAIA